MDQHTSNYLLDLPPYGPDYVFGLDESIPGTWPNTPQVPSTPTPSTPSTPPPSPTTTTTATITTMPSASTTSTTSTVENLFKQITETFNNNPLVTDQPTTITSTVHRLPKTNIEMPSASTLKIKTVDGKQLFETTKPLSLMELIHQGLESYRDVEIEVIDEIDIKTNDFYRIPF